MSSPSVLKNSLIESQIYLLEPELCADLIKDKEFKDWEAGDQFFGGFDVGKKKHPSHLVIFRKRGDKLQQVHSSFLDGWSYSDQIEFLNEVADNFQLTSGYIDNTRGELEDRGLDTRWRGMHFTLKAKNTMAGVFENFVHSGILNIIKDERQKQQILSVSNELKAPETPMGHGDAFFSIAMALQSAHDTAYKFVDLGSATDWFNAISPGETPESKQSMLDEKKGLVKEGEPSVNPLQMQPVNQVEKASTAPNPQCAETVCNPSFWVVERGLCLYCGHRQ